MNQVQQIGKGISPSTLVQLAIGSVPPIDPRFFNLVDNIVDVTAPVPANQLISHILSRTGGADPFEAKYLKYKSKYLQLKNKLRY